MGVVAVSSPLAPRVGPNGRERRNRKVEIPDRRNPELDAGDAALYFSDD